jgi:hypothetical protein
MAKSKMKRKRAPKSVVKLPDLEQSKSAVPARNGSCIPWPRALSQKIQAQAGRDR